MKALHPVECARRVGELGVTTTDDVAEGSWYLVTLTKSSGDIDDPELFTGDLFDPDIDMLPAE